MPQTKTRTAKIHIYKVTFNGESKLVRTTSRARAIKHVLNPETIEAAIATQDELVELLGQEVEVEEAAE